MQAIDRRQVVGRPHRAARGYTLIELGIVLGVLGLLSGMILPDFIELAKNQLAKNTAIQLLNMQDQARIFFHQTLRDAAGNYVPPEEGVWPGETSFNTCATKAIGPSDPPIQDLVNAGQLASANLQNAWLQPIRARLMTPPIIGAAPTLVNAACSVQFSTDVPTTVAGVLTAYLPGGVCGGGCGSTAIGFTRCCVYTGKPGIEASLAAARWLIDN